MRSASFRVLASLAFVSVLVGCSDDETTTPPIVEDDAPITEVKFETPAFDVAPGDEVQNCYFYKVSDLLGTAGLPVDEPLNLHHVRITQPNSGSHHMNIFRVRTIKGLDPAAGPDLGLNGMGECFKSANWADWPLVANTQVAGEGNDFDWQFPKGVANIIAPDEYLMVQTHYVNATTQETPSGTGEVDVSFGHIPASYVVEEMGTLFATRQSIRICQSNPAPSYGGGCQVKSDHDINIIGANGHFHSRGKQFDMFTWDGSSITEPPAEQRFYESTAWDEPPMLISPDLNVVVPPNGGVWYTCDFQWQQPTVEAGGCQALDDWDKTKYGTADEDLDCCYTFGPVVEKNEHCNVFVYYYPKVDDIFCN
jgi:hypothetical protein